MERAGGPVGGAPASLIDFDIAGFLCAGPIKRMPMAVLANKWGRSGRMTELASVQYSQPCDVVVFPSPCPPKQITGIVPSGRAYSERSIMGDVGDVMTGRCAKPIQTSAMTHRMDRALLTVRLIFMNTLPNIDKIIISG